MDRQEGTRRLSVVSRVSPHDESFLADHSAQRPSRIATFSGDASLQIDRLDGTLTDRLQCEPNELLEYGWHPFVHPDDWDAIEHLGRDLGAGIGSSYELRALSLSGERLFIVVRTLLLLGSDRQYGPMLNGVIDLVHWESPRRYFDLGG